MPVFEREYLMPGISSIADVLNTPAKRSRIQAEWLRNIAAAVGRSNAGTISSEELSAQTEEFLRLLGAAVNSSGGSTSIESPSYKPLLEFLEGVSRSRAAQGFTSSETAVFIFSFKQPLFEQLRADNPKDANALAQDIWSATQLLDNLGMHTVRTFQRSREEIIRRQQEEMLELSTPVVKLWDGILALPMIGTLDSARTQVVMESLLNRIVETGSQIAILDITGVPTVDTLVAQHLLKTVTALRLMGAECIISGVRPQIAQTIVHLGVDLQGVTTKANLADALALALKRIGCTVARV
jgi:rsbT co-antagonist protein RsbR